MCCGQGCALQVSEVTGEGLRVHLAPVSLGSQSQVQAFFLALLPLPLLGLPPWCHLLASPDFPGPGRCSRQTRLP